MPGFLLGILVENNRNVMYNEINEDSLDYTEWFRYVSSDSHLANYVKKSERFDCEWDEKGNKI